MSVFTTDADVAAYAFQRLHMVLMFQWLASSYEVSGSYMRALGYSVAPMVLTIFGTCVLRLGWVYIYTDIDHSFTSLLSIYPVSWIVTGIAVIGAAFLIQRKAFAPAVRR